MVIVTPYSEPNPLYFRSSKEFFLWKKSNVAFLNSFKSDINSVFYPGAGFDLETLIFCLDYTDAREIFYVDYGGQDNLDKLIQLNLEHNFLFSVGAQIYTPKDFWGISNWSELWHPDSPKPDKLEEFTFIKEIEIYYLDKFVLLYYINADAFGTYSYFISKGIDFGLVICQDHGLGGFWSNFCGDSHLSRIASSKDKFPKYLMVGKDHDAWSNYHRCTEDFGQFGLNKTSRGIFELKF